MKTHKDLIVWQKSIVLVKKVYALTQTFPKDEMFGLISQMRRCAVSIPSNIAEGHGRGSEKELVRFLEIALGSTAELETQLIISKELGFVTVEDFETLIREINEIVKMLSALNRNHKLEK